MRLICLQIDQVQLASNLSNNLFDHAAKPLLEDFMKSIDTDVIGSSYGANQGNGVDNQELIQINEIIRYHPVEMIGYELRASMTAMKKIV